MTAPLTPNELRDLSTFLVCHGKLSRDQRNRFSNGLLVLARTLEGNPPPAPQCPTCKAGETAKDRRIQALQGKLVEARLSTANAQAALATKTPVVVQVRPRQKSLSVLDRVRLEREILAGGTVEGE